MKPKPKRSNGDDAPPPVLPACRAFGKSSSSIGSLQRHPAKHPGRTRYWASEAMRIWRGAMWGSGEPCADLWGAICAARQNSPFCRALYEFRAALPIADHGTTAVSDGKDTASSDQQRPLRLGCLAREMPYRRICVLTNPSRRNPREQDGK